MEDANDDMWSCDTCSRYNSYKEDGVTAFLELGDGRQLCSDCSSIAVTTQEERNFIIQSVFEFFRIKNLQVNENIHFLFINNNQMRKILKCLGMQDEFEPSGMYYPSLSAATQNTTTHSLPSKIWYVLTMNILPKLVALCTTQMRQEYLSCGVNTEKSFKSFLQGETILVLSGQPVEVGGVLAHEMMHAWLFLHAKPFEMEESVVEGICQVMCYEWMQWFSSTGFNTLHKTNEQLQYTRKLKDCLAKGIETWDDEVYGQGFRNAMRAIETNGFKYTLDYTIKNGRLPLPKAE